MFERTTRYSEGLLKNNEVLDWTYSSPLQLLVVASLNKLPTGSPNNYICAVKDAKSTLKHNTNKPLLFEKPVASIPDFEVGVTTIPWILEKEWDWEDRTPGFKIVWRREETDGWMQLACNKKTKIWPNTKLQQWDSEMLWWWMTLVELTMRRNELI